MAEICLHAWIYIEYHKNIKYAIFQQFHGPTKSRTIWPKQQRIESRSAIKKLRIKKWSSVIVYVVAWRKSFSLTTAFLTFILANMTFAWEEKIFVALKATEAMARLSFIAVPLLVVWWRNREKWAITFKSDCETFSSKKDNTSNTTGSFVWLCSF